MLKYLRENNKKILAVLGVFLMIAFIIPPAAKRMSGSGGAQPIGHIGKEPVTAAEFKQAEDEWRSLTAIVNEYLRQGGEWDRLGDLPRFVSMQRGGMDATSYMLLYREAAQMGIQPDAPYVNELLTLIGKTLEKSQMGLPAGFDTALARWHMIQEAFSSRVLPAVKVSPAVGAYEALDRKQQVSLAIIPFRADEFRKRITGATTQPSDAQFSAFFDKYKDKEPGSGAFGFGYRLPKRLSLQYLMIPRDSILQRITYRDLYRAYVENPNRFLREEPEESEEAVAPTTMATTRPTTGPALVATTQPTTGPAVAATTQPAKPPKVAKAPSTQPATFDELSARQLDELRDMLADRGAAELAKKLYTKMTDHWTKYHQAEAGAVPVTDLGVKYDSPEYLEKLAADAVKIGSDSKVEDNAWKNVRPLVNQDQIEEYLKLNKALRNRWFVEPAASALGNLDFRGPSQSTALMPIKSLDELPGIGRVYSFALLRAFYRPFMGPAELQGLSQAANERQQKLSTLANLNANLQIAMSMLGQRPDMDKVVEQLKEDIEFTKRTIPSAVGNPVQLQEPGAPLKDTAGNYYIFRVVRAEPDVAPGSYAAYEDKEQVRKDYIEYESYQLALKEAQKCFEKLQEAIKSKKEQPMVEAAFDFNRQPEITEQFSNEPGQSPKLLALSTAGSEQFRQGAFQLLRDKLEGKSQQPVGLIQVPRDRSVVVAQLEKAWPGAVKADQLQQAMRSEMQMAIAAAYRNWFSPSAIRERMQYRPVSERRDRTSGEPQQPEGEPMPERF